MKTERFHGATLHLADWQDVIPTAPPDAAIISDPPYGMDWNTDSTRFTGGGQKRGDGREWQKVNGDKEPFDPAPFLAFPEVVLWGANHYAQRLPVGCTLVWIKKPAHLYGTFLSDAEIGWAKGGYGVYVHYKSFPPPSRIHEAALGTGRAGHPTQKPLSLMSWCINEFAPKAAVVFDPFMGSGSTGVACVDLGRDFIGCDNDPVHFDVACRRVEAAASRGRLL